MTWVGRTQTAAASSTPAAIACAVELAAPGAPENKTAAAASSSAAPSGSEKNQPEYAPTGVARASIPAAASEVFVGIPSRRKSRSASATAAAENAALLPTRKKSLNKSCAPGGTLCQRATQRPSASQGSAATDCPGRVWRLRAAKAIGDAVEQVGLHGLRHGRIPVQVETFGLEVGRNLINRADAAGRGKQVEKIEEQEKREHQSPLDSAPGCGWIYLRVFSHRVAESCSKELDHTESGTRVTALVCAA